jgi:hypothetical protein
VSTGASCGLRGMLNLDDLGQLLELMRRSELPEG